MKQTIANTAVKYLIKRMHEEERDFPPPTHAHQDLNSSHSWLNCKNFATVLANVCVTKSKTSNCPYWKYFPNKTELVELLSCSATTLRLPQRWSCIREGKGIKIQFPLATPGATYSLITPPQAAQPSVCSHLTGSLQKLEIKKNAWMPAPVCGIQMKQIPPCLI